MWCQRFFYFKKNTKIYNKTIRYFHRKVNTYYLEILFPELHFQG